jgi:Arc/MetJ family transcription regulator
MRTNIVIDERLMRAAMKAAGTRTKRETVEFALKIVSSHAARRRAYARLLAAAGSGGFFRGYSVARARRRIRSPG